MNTNNPSTFSWDKTNDRPTLTLESEKAKDGIEIQAFGADDEMANTMFAVFAGDERLLVRRPEPVLNGFVESIIERGAFTLVIGDDWFKVELDDERKERLKTVKQHLDDGLEKESHNNE